MVVNNAPDSKLTKGWALLGLENKQIIRIQNIGRKKNLYFKLLILNKGALGIGRTNIKLFFDGVIPKQKCEAFTLGN
jgi:hypothetical protein